MRKTFYLSALVGLLWNLALVDYRVWLSLLALLGVWLGCKSRSNQEKARMAWLQSIILCFVASIVTVWFLSVSTPIVGTTWDALAILLTALPVALIVSGVTVGRGFQDSSKWMLLLFILPALAALLCLYFYLGILVQVKFDWFGACVWYFAPVSSLVSGFWVWIASSAK